MEKPQHEVPSPKHEIPAPKKKHEHRQKKERAPKTIMPPQPPRRSHPSSPAPTQRGR